MPAQNQTELPAQPSPALPPALARTLPDLRQDAPKPVDKKYPAVVAAADSMQFAGVGSKVWQVATLVIPILLTVWLTHVSSSSEDRVKLEIDQQTDQQKQVFAEQVQLSQDLYKRQFDAYDKLYAQLLNLGNAIERLDAGSSPVLWNRRLTDSDAKLRKASAANKPANSPRHN